MRSDRERDYPRVLVVGSTPREAERLVSESANLAGATATSVMGVFSGTISGHMFAAVFVTEAARRHRSYCSIVEPLRLAVAMSPTHLLMGGDGRNV